MLSSGRQLKSRVLQSALFQTREIRCEKPFPLPTRDVGVGLLWRREPSYRPDFSLPVWLQETWVYPGLQLVSASPSILFVSFIPKEVVSTPQLNRHVGYRALELKETVRQGFSSSALLTFWAG